jgi:hypothetical protein
MRSSVLHSKMLLTAISIIYNDLSLPHVVDSAVFDLRLLAVMKNRHVFDNESRNLARLLSE